MPNNRAVSAVTGLLCGLFLLAGCGVDGQENAAGVVDLDTTPLFEIRIASGDTGAGLAVITDATLLPDGGVAVLDGISSRVHLHDAAGGPGLVFGREGEGPGEFRMPSIIISCGPTNPIGVWDRARARLTFLSLDGGLKEVVQVTGVLADLSCHHDQVIAMKVTGDYSNPGPGAPPVTGELRTVWPMSDTVLILSDIVLGRTRPLGELSSYAWFDSLVVFGTAANDSLIVISRSGAPNRVFRLGLTLQPVLPHQYEAAIVAQSKMLPRPEDQLVVQEMMRRMPPPANLPYFRNMTAGNDGELWVTTSPFGDSLTHINVYDIIAEKQIGTATLPMDATILGISQDRMLVKFPDQEMGGDRLVVYRIESRNTGSESP